MFTQFDGSREMSPHPEPQELDSAKYLAAAAENVSTESQGESHRSTQSLLTLASGISTVLIVSLVIGGGYWLLASRDQVIKSIKQPVSVGELITGKTWEEAQAEGLVNEFNMPFWPESTAVPSRFEVRELQDLSQGWRYDGK